VEIKANLLRVVAFAILQSMPFQVLRPCPDEGSFSADLLGLDVALDIALRFREVIRFDPG
jgi:hypothetical protein